ncbi:MAG: HAD family phosphatase [Chloroflexota bacterium]|nr:HAD family phosphatase [Chloroflexota bacterium]
MDGTILDTKACHFFCWQTTLKNFGFEMDKKIFDANFGRNTRSTMPLYLGFDPDEALFDQILDDYRRRLMHLMPQQSSLVPGVVSWLQDFKDHHVPQVIVSSAAMETLESILTTFDLRDYFDHIIAGAELPAKPEPDVFLKAAKALDYAPENCCVIEDSRAGVMGAKAAGMHCIAVTTTFAKSDLSLADAVISDFTTQINSVLEEVGMSQLILTPD